MKYLLTIIALLAAPAYAVAQMGGNLVPPESATHTAVCDGSWQDAATWGGTIPGDGSRVYVPAGIHVTNHAATADVLWLHVAGTVDACTHCTTQLNVHTLYVPMGGAFHLGEPGMPCEQAAVLEFLPGAFLAGDWQQLSRGVVCHGAFTVCGLEKTTWDVVDGDLAVGATSLKLRNVPLSWSVGDRILIAGTDSFVGEQRVNYQSEYRTIASINGRTVHFGEPLVYRHFRWREDLPFHCLNLSSNAVIRSRDAASRGHLMFMSASNHIWYALEETLGRTDKSLAVTDPRIDPITLALVPGSDANPRGRYSDHNHRALPLKAPSTRRGVVVRGSPGWGLVNHNSNCQWDDCVAVECFGFGFGTEEGQERGHIRRCVGAMNRGRGDTVTSTDSDFSLGTGDFGSDGAGFWLHGGLVEVSDCVAFDNSGRGFGLFNNTLNSYPRYGGGSQTPEYLRYPIEVDASLLSEEYAGMGAVPSSYVPQRAFARNTAYGNKVGLQAWNALFTTPNPDQAKHWPIVVRGSISALTLWGRGAKLHLEYARQMNVSGAKVIGDQVIPGRQVTTNSDNPVHVRGAEITIRGLEIEGYTRVGSTVLRPIFDSAPDAGHVIDGTYPIVTEGGVVVR